MVTDGPLEKGNKGRITIRIIENFRSSNGNRFFSFFIFDFRFPKQKLRRKTVTYSGYKETNIIRVRYHNLLHLIQAFYDRKMKIELIIFCQYLDKLSPPLTLPSGVTLPPAASIRFISGSSSGLCQASSLSTPQINHVG